MPARVSLSRSACRAGASSGRVTTACRLSTWAPLAQRSLQACRVVSRALSQASATSAGKPSTLCSSRDPSPAWAITAASSALPGVPPPRPLRARASCRGLAANLAAQPRQAIAAPPSGPMAFSSLKPAMKRRSTVCFQRHSSGLGPRAHGPQKATAWGLGLLPSPSSCSAQRWGRQGRSSRPATTAFRLWARVWAQRTAQTPEAGLGLLAITPQSPLANSLGCRHTCRLASVSRRPSLLQARPEAVSQRGARLPVQARSAAASSGQLASMAMPALSSSCSPNLLAAFEPRFSWLPRSCSLGCWPLARSARATSTAAAPPPRMRTLPDLGWLHQSKKGSRGFTAMAAWVATLVSAPTSRLSQSQRRLGRPASASSRPSGSIAVISACTKVTPASRQRRRRSMAQAAGS